MIRRHYLLSVISLVAFIGVCFAVTASAEIYQWVDEHGNTQFGDKPHDPEAVRNAEKVEIVESYKPTERTPEEQRAYEEEQQALKRRREVYEQEDLDARSQAQQQARERQAALCHALKKEIEQKGQLEIANGYRTLHFYTDENGKSVSSERQREILEQLKTRYAKECE